MAIEIDSYSSGGKTLCCEFLCQRCGKTEVLPFKNCVRNDEGGRYLRNVSVPNGWSDHFYGWLLCDECTQKLKAFMKMEVAEDG